MEQMERYLRATPTIDCDNESIKEKALDLTKGQVDTADKAKSIFTSYRSGFTSLSGKGIEISFTGHQ